MNRFSPETHTLCFFFLLRHAVQTGPDDLVYRMDMDIFIGEFPSLSEEEIRDMIGCFSEARIFTNQPPSIYETTTLFAHAHVHPKAIIYAVPPDVFRMAVHPDFKTIASLAIHNQLAPPDPE